MGSGGAGLRPDGFQTERERKERGVGWEKRELTGGPVLSAGERERGGREGEAAGPAQEGARGRGGCWASRPKRGRERENSFYFFLNNFFFNAFSKWIFNQFDICFQNTHHIKEMLRHECNINISLSLFIFPILKCSGMNFSKFYLFSLY